MKVRLKHVAIGLPVLVVLFVGVGLARNVCLSAWLRHGFVTATCPAGEVRPWAGISLSAPGRGKTGTVTLSARALFTTGRPDEVRHAPTPVEQAELFLVRSDRPAGKARVPLTPQPSDDGDLWMELQEGSWSGRIALPADLNDGDHKLVAEVRSSAGLAVVEAALPVYAPARVHVITDRPLYEPGHTVQFRAVVLRARDLAPLEGRAGRFVVTDPAGEVVLEERAPAGPWGVASGELPLDAGARTGRWRVRWESAGASDEVGVRVEPFTLPRFTVDLSSVRPFWLPGEAPRLLGEVRYTSGAPVPADVELRWSSSGAWPPPTSWLEESLPRRAKTDAAGRFELALPAVPQDLVGQATLQATVTAVDPTGDEAGSTASVLLSQDAIRVEAVTELGGGRLVEGFNNRVYLRVTTAAGRPLRGVHALVRRAWDPSDPGEKATTDDDGVTALQLDPGPPVTVLLPQPPVRPPPALEPLRRSRAHDLVSGGSPPLSDVVELDRWNTALTRCARYATGSALQVSLILDVLPSGQVAHVMSEGAAGTCLAEVIERRELPRGGARILQLDYELRSDLPTFEMTTVGTRSLPQVVQRAFSEALLDARSCLPEAAAAASARQMVLWRHEDERFTARVSDDPGGARPRLDPSVERCLFAALRTALAPRQAPRALEGADLDDAMGVLRFRSVPGPRSPMSSRRSPTTTLGYELLVSATADDEWLGSTRLVLSPGEVPDLRLRATPVLASAGGPLVVEVLRGPGFAGREIPEKLFLHHVGGALEAPLDPATRKATFTLPADRDGWYEVRLESAVARAYVRPASELSVDVTPDRPVYAPGDTARLTLTTTARGRAVPAAVGLFGVDETLGVLAPLPGTDDLSRVQPAIAMSQPAFGALYAQALVQGRIQGEHAAAATVLLVSNVPTPPELDGEVNAQAHTAFDPLASLTDHFYGVLDELHAQVRHWEATAPHGEVMRPATMASLWQEALKARRAAGHEVDDAFGRPLTLEVLPEDLLELAGPRAVVIDGKRLPEDVESWPEWVRRNAS